MSQSEPEAWVRIEQKRQLRGAVGVGLELGCPRKVRTAKRSVLRGPLWYEPEVRVLVPVRGGK